MPNGTKLEPIYKQIGRSIKFHRLLHGMTQVELGKKLGRSRMSIAQMECGTQRVQLHTLLHMQELIGVSLDALVGCGLDGDSYSNIGKRMLPHLGGVKKS